MAKKKNKASRKTQPRPEYVGRLQMTREGFGFVIIDGDDKGDVFVKSSKMRGALNGDTVRIVIKKDIQAHVPGKAFKRSEHREGEVIEIVERSSKPFVGILTVVEDRAWVIMQSRVMPYDIAIPYEQVVAKGIPSGTKVAVRVVSWGRHDPEPVGTIVDVLGEPGENDTEMHAILAEYCLPYRFPSEIEAAANAIKDDLTPEEFAKRRDFRDVLTFTIDPSDAKDFDDALSARKLPDGKWEFGVHIADVTHYVRPGTRIDAQAKERATSVYLVDRTVPMLPEMLSNKLCSLRPGEEKLCFSVVFTMDDDARVTDRWVGRTVIRSDYRFDYDAAQKIIEGVAPDAGSKFDLQESDPNCTTLKEAVLKAHSLAQKLRQERFRNGAISFERPEMKVIVDEKGRPIDVCRKISKESNWLIEEFMLLANRTVAEIVAKIGKTFVYRIHEEPNSDKLEALRHFVGNFGYKLKPLDASGDVSRSLNELFEKSKGTPEADVIELLALRSMAKARYTTDNCGHYGLAFKYYTHFTSPIRRYPDMMVHRLLAKYLDGGPSQNRKRYEQLCQYCSEREQIAADAERASIKYKLVEFMQDKVGFEYDGTISGLTEWGMYVEIEPTRIEGMVALRDISGDYYQFDEDNYRIVGRSSRRVFTLGDKVRIRVRNANLEQKLLDYDLIMLEEPAATTQQKQAKRKKSTSKSGKSPAKRSSGKKSS